MLFNSIEYFILILFVVPLYWSLSNLNARLILLLLSSCIFYATWEPFFLLLLLGAIGANFTISTLILNSKKALIVFGILFNVGLLAFFKYTNFFIDILNDIADILSLQFEQSRFSIILPLGISFFTFQLIAYIIDVQAKKIGREKSLLRFSVFISFFPQLIAGPICRGSEFLPQLRVLQPFRMANFIQGILMVCVGLFLKIGIADNLAPYIETIYDNRQGVDTLRGWIATIAFSVQILCDFWGYSTMALGTALTFGITIPANFDLPYIATTLQSFWRRWHITLSFWLRDYLYFSFGGNRKGTVRTGMNLIAVMGIGGLWHGANYNFIIWGLIHGSWLLIERYTITGLQIMDIPRSIALAWRPIGWLITMLVILTAWVFFRANTLDDAMYILNHMFTMSGEFSLNETDGSTTLLLLVFFAMMIPLHMLNQAGLNTNFYKTAIKKHCKGKIDGKTSDNMPWFVPPIALSGRFQVSGDVLILPSPVKLTIAFWLLILSVILGAGETVPFIYFQF